MPLVKTGLSLDERDVDRLDELADTLNSRRSNKATRSEAAREVIPLGVSAWQIIDSYAQRSMNVREREAWLREALHNHNAEEFADDPDVLIDVLAETEGIPRAELERAILELKTD